MPSLTMSEARARAALLTVDSYELDVDLTGAAGAVDTFRTTTTVRFRTTRPGATTFVELRPTTLRSARLNGAWLDPSALAGGRLPLADLASENELVVEADYRYSRASEGMHRFVDPADGAVYVYAQPAIAQAPAFMACFDQPDLKASVTLRVAADPRWRVCATGAATQTGDGRWQFAPTPPLPTYLITVAAGPFHAVHREHDGIPLGLFARASLAEHLDAEAEELFAVTAACLDRYHELFGIRYPFDGYDQVFAPEFSWGAMEFPGCVLIRDELVFRSAVTDADRQRRAVLIAHEMAHMWFGNLVTMRWWDDLWLNESFADYLGWRVVAEATRWRDAWAGYAAGRKVWGLVADQRPSTHPVAGAEVTDTDAALTNFDGISYAKGSAVLRQLVAWIGDQAFLSGLRDYFQAYAFRNATLHDLLAALSRASGRDLVGWAERWLRTSGVDTLAPEATIGPDGRYSAVHLRQQPPAGGKGRPHRVAVGVYRAEGPSLVRHEQALLEVDPEHDSGRTEVPDLAGVPAGLLLVNDGDLTYAKPRLETAGWASLADDLPRVAAPLARALLWTAAWDACRDGELPAQELAAVAAAALPAETEEAVFETIVEAAAGTVVGRYLPPDRRPAARAALAAACREALASAAPGSGRQLAAARGLIRCAGPAEAPWLAGWLTGEGIPPGLAVDADLRWSILAALAALGAADLAQIEAEAARDRTARGEQEAVRCRAALPDPAAKQWAWQLVTTDRVRSNRILQAAAEGFWRSGQEELTAGYVARYFTEIPATAAWRSQQLLASVATAAYPRYAVSPETLAAARDCLAREDLHPVVRRAVVDATDDLRRALLARERASRSQTGGDRA